MPNLLGQKPNQVPTNADLGTMARQSHEAVVVKGGKIDGVILGGDAPVTGTFTQLTVTANTAAEALKLSQIGAGLLIKLENQAVSTHPLTVDKNAKVIFGDTTSTLTFDTISPSVIIDGRSRLDMGLAIIQHRPDSAGPRLIFAKSRAANSNDVTAAANNDVLGEINFYAADSVGYTKSASIYAGSQAAATNGVAPGYISFNVTPLAGGSPVEAIRINSEGNIGLGTSTLTNIKLRLAGSIAGSSNAYGIYTGLSVKSGVTTAYGNATALTVDAGHALTSLYHYAAGQATLGSGATVSIQGGFLVNANVSGGATNYGYRGLIAAATSNWNLYMDGTAQNYLAGSLGIGVTNPLTDLHVKKTTPVIRLESTASGATAFDGTGSGFDLISASMDTSAKYTPAIRFGSTDSAFTTTNPKFGAAILGEAAQTYSSDNTGGMNLCFWVAPTFPGTGHGMALAMRIMSTKHVLPGGNGTQDFGASDTHWRNIFTDGLNLSTNAAAAKLLQSDASGNASWGPTVGQTDTGIPTNADVKSYYNARYTPALDPTLLMDFRNNRFILKIQDQTIRSNKFSDILSSMVYTRSSTAIVYNELGQMEVAAADQLLPEYHPKTGAAMGIFIGAAKTNYCLYSEDKTQWTLLDATEEVDTWDFMGRATAPIYKASAVATPHRISRNLNNYAIGTTAASYSAFIYLPSGSDVSFIAFRCRSTYNAASSGQCINIVVSGNGENATLTFQGSSPFGTNPPSAISSADFSYENLGGGIYRITVLSAVNNNAGAIFQVIDISFSSGASESVAGTANTRFGVCGFQVELNSISPYMPSTATVGSRTTANLKINDPVFSKFFNKKEGTVVAKLRIPGKSPSTRYFYGANNGGSSDYIRGRINADSTNLAFLVLSGGSGQFTSGAYSFSINTPIAVANGYKTNDGYIAFSSSGTADSSLTVPTGLDRFEIGGSNDAAQADAYIEYLAYYPRKLTNAEHLELCKF